MSTTATTEKSDRARMSAAHDHAIRRKRMSLTVLLILLVVGVLLDLVTGPAALSLDQVWQGLWGSEGSDRITSLIMWQVRMPTALLAVLIGAGLSLAGAEMQTILANPLSSPFTLGVSSAASFGAALAIILGVSLPWVPDEAAVSVNAFVMGFGAVMCIQAVAAMRCNPAALVLFGIAMVFGFNALVATVQFLAPATSLQQLVFWTMGSLERADTVSVLVMSAVLLVTIPFSMRAAWAMTLLSLGEERASSLGVNPRSLRFGCLFRASLLASIAVAFVGTIGFVGLVGPHIARLLVGEDHRYFLPAALLCGCVVMSFSSVVAKVIIPGVVLPIGIVTSLVGLPCFVALLLMGKGRQ